MKVIPSLFVGRSVGSRWLAASVIAILAIFVTGAANDLFSSNVVTLTSSNWKEHVLDNPHMVLVNICRKGEWEKLAASVKGMVTIAYWDTQGGSRPPRLLGEYQGTPTIRLFTPKRKPRKAGSVSEKNVLDYQHGERKASDLRRFLENQMPNYVERIKFGKEDYDRLSAKALRFGLPLAVVFTTKAQTSTNLKWLSAQYRRRLLMVEVPPTDKNKGLREEILGAEEGDGSGAALYVISSSSDSKNVRFEGDKFTRRKLQDFLDQHALSEPVLNPPSAGEAGSEEKQQKHDEF